MDWLGKSMEKWRDLGKNLGKPPCKVVPVDQRSIQLIDLQTRMLWNNFGLVGWNGWLVVLRINVDLAIFQPYLDLEAGNNQSLKIQVARPGIEPRSSCSASQELNHSATAAPWVEWNENVTLLQSNGNLETGDTQSLKSYRRSSTDTLQYKSITTTVHQCRFV